MNIHSGFDASARRFSEAGVTLVELLLTIVILGTVAIAALAGVTQAIASSASHRSMTTASMILRNYAEQLKAPDGQYVYVPCATSSTYPAYRPVQPPNTGIITTSVTQIRYWDGRRRSDVQPEAGFTTTCSTDNGVQEITLEVTVNDGGVRTATETMVVFKRDARQDRRS